MFTLSENGIMFFSGYNGYGISGNGSTSAISRPLPIGFYDTDRTTKLTGANYPKIKMFHWTSTRSDNTSTYDSVAAVDTDGFLYLWGYNGYGQLLTGNTTSNYYASRIPKSKFGGRPVVYVTSSSTRYTSFYAITDDPNGELVYRPFPGYNNLLSSGQIRDPYKNDGLPDRLVPKTDVIAYTSSQVVWNDYEFTIDDLPTFRIWSIKLIGTGTNQAQPPRMKNLRVLALA